MRQKNTKNQIVIPKVTGPDDVNFKLTLSGKWSWNRDLAGPVYDQWSGQMWPTGFQEMSLRNAFQRMLADRIFDRCEAMFETALLAECTFTPEMESAFKAGCEGLSEQERAAAEAELKETEERAAKLRARLGK